MFEFFRAALFGKTIKCISGKEFISILVLENGFHLAVIPNDKIPCNVYLIKEEISEELLKDK